MNKKNITLPRNFFSPKIVSEFVRRATHFSTTRVSLKCGSAIANAKSPLAVMCINTGYPVDIEIVADGPDEKKAIADLCSYINEISKEPY